MIQYTEPHEVERLLPLAQNYYNAARQDFWPTVWADDAAHIRDVLSQAAEHGEDLAGNPLGLMHIEDGGTIIAFVLVLAVPAYFCPKLLQAQELMIWADPDHRGKGLASQLVRGAEIWAAKFGAPVVYFSSWANITPDSMDRLLEKNDFTLHQKTFEKRV